MTSKGKNTSTVTANMNKSRATPVKGNYIMDKKSVVMILENEEKYFHVG